ncbi:MAG: polyprenyl diphosphate synthase [Simkaniaceae bacterium]
MHKTKLIPQHVAIVMDGNRRFARKQGILIRKGHEKGAENLEKVISFAIEKGIKILTLYAFSTENWNRRQKEIRALLNILKNFLIHKRSVLADKGVKMTTIGDLSVFPNEIQDEIETTKAATRNGTQLNLVLALNYGARSEIVKAAKWMAQDYKDSKISSSDFCEKNFASYLDTAGMKDPDLFIRTSGEYRISNFLLWQISYAELYMTKTLWPEFGPGEFQKALDEYAIRERRIGE